MSLESDMASQCEDHPITCDCHVCLCIVPRVRFRHFVQMVTQVTLASVAQAHTDEWGPAHLRRHLEDLFRERNDAYAENRRLREAIRNLERGDIPQ